MNFLKKIVLIFILSFINCFMGLGAYATVKINNVSFDSSNAFMFLSTSNYLLSQPQEVKAMSLKNPNRVFFDINDAVLTRPNESWYFRNSDIKQIRVSQFSTNPNVVRVVFYHTENFNPKNISVINVKGNYFFKYGNIALGQSNYMKSYRSVHAEDSDYMEKTVYIPQSEIAQVQMGSTSNSTAKDVQKAFSAVASSTSSTVNVPNKAVIEPNSFSWSKVFKLRTNYFLSRVDVKRGNILLLGAGRITLEKPLYLENPKRVVFDIPNAVVAQKFKNVEILLSETETLKVGQFEPSKVRLVVTTPQPELFRPIFSSDGQGLLLGHDSRMSGIKLYEKTAQVMKMATKAENSLTDIFAVSFSSPIVYSVKEIDSKLEIIIYNAVGGDENTLRKALEQSKLQLKAKKAVPAGLMYEFNLQAGAEVEVYTKEDGTQLQVRIKNRKFAPVQPKEEASGMYKGCGLIMIDPGHGGVDGGAIRDGINEKDINLDVSKMVAQILRKKGYNVDLTRWDDSTLSLENRVEYSDSNKASLFVSIHVNSSVSSDPNGIETHWWTQDGYELAQVVHTEFSKKVKALDRGLVKSKFYVINHTKARAILVEIGFISNDNERKELITQSRKQKTAEGIAEGIMKFIKKEGLK